MAKIIRVQKPTIYQFEENGEHFMLGVEVGEALGYYKGNLYKRFPSLWRRVMTAEEREGLYSLGTKGNQTLSNLGTMVVRAKEAEKILNGEGDEFRRKDTDTAKYNNRNKEAINIAFNRPCSSSEDEQSDSSLAISSVQRRKLSFFGVRNRGKPTADKNITLENRFVSSVPVDWLSGTPVSVNRKRRSVNRTNLRMKLLPSLRYDDHDMGAIHEAAKDSEDLIPIRLDVELDGQKLRDTFTWNKNEKLISLESFAEVLCDDLDLPVSSFVPAIVQSMQQQIRQHSVESEITLNDMPDQRVIIKLNLHVGNVSLQDQFEWDMSEPLNNPEQFALSLCTELGLGGEFVTAIAYSIRGQLNWNAKTYALVENPLLTLESPIRTGTDVDRWCPYLETLTDAEMEKKLRDQDRNTRRMRRLANTAPYSLAL